MTCFRFMPLLLCLACGTDKSDDETGADTADTGHIDRPEQPDACTPELKVDGTAVSELPSPAPGDAWTILMFCDGALQLGTYTLQADPPDLVTIDSSEPIVTFVSPGTVTLDYRMGTKRAAVDITIVE